MVFQASMSEMNPEGQLEGTPKEFLVKSWSDMQNALDQFAGPTAMGMCAYRGQADTKWPLEPSLERLTRRLIRKRAGSNWDESSPIRRSVSLSGKSVTFDLAATMMSTFEKQMVARVRAHADTYNVAYLPENRLHFHYLATLRHHGAPSRLLDWTRSPFVALFFAIEDVHNDAAPAIWILNIVALRVALIATFKGLPYLTQAPFMLAMENYPSAEDLAVVSHMLEWGPVHEDFPFGVLWVSPDRISERMSAQQGLFVLPLNLKHSFEYNLQVALERAKPIKVICDIPFAKITLAPDYDRAYFLRQLASMNISRQTLFPGLDGFIQSMWHLCEGMNSWATDPFFFPDVREGGTD